MNYSIFQFFYGLGQSYSLLGAVALILSGPFSYIVFPTLVLGFFSTRAASIKYFILVFCSGVFAWASARMFKEIFRIVRPFHTHGLVPLAPQTGYSFPSEHAAVFAALTVILFRFDYRLGIASLVLTILVMISRMVIGVHYPLDVLVGAGLGAIVAWGCATLYTRLFV